MFPSTNTTFEYNRLTPTKHIISFPGISKERISVEITNGDFLTVFLDEEYCTRVSIPNNVDLEKIEASMKDGMLTIDFTNAISVRKLVIK